MKKDDITMMAIEGDLKALKKAVPGKALPKGILHSVIFSGWAQGEDVEVLRYLIDQGADINQIYEKSRPIHEAARVAPFPSRSLATTSLLLELGVDPNSKDSLGQTPLHISAASIAVDTTKKLLEAGADVNAQAKDGRTPLQNCLEWFPENISGDEYKEDEEYDNANMYVNNQIAALLPYNPEIRETTTGLFISLALQFNMSEEIIRKLLKLRAPVPAFIISGDQTINPLLFVSLHQYSNELLGEITEHKTAESPAWPDGPPVIVYFAQQDPEYCKYLCEKNPELLNVRMESNASLLHSAAAGDDLAIVKWLVKKGLDPKLVSKKGQTPFDLANENGKKKIAQYLKAFL